MSSYSGNLDLYLEGINTPSGLLDIYASGSTSPTAYMPLFLQVFDPSSINNYVNLSLFSTQDVSGVVGNLDLYLQSVTPSGIESSGLNLFLIGPDFIVGTGILNLYTEGGVNSAHSYLPLFILNNYAATGIQLYTKGASPFGEPDLGIDRTGYIPIGSGLNLFINRVDENAVLDLFLKTSEGASSGVIDLFLPSASGSNNNMDLVLPNVYGQLTSNITLYTHGF